MSAIVGGLQQIGAAKAKIGLYVSPFIGIVFCCVGYLLIKASRQSPSGSPGPVPSPSGSPGPVVPTPVQKNQPPPIGVGIFFIVCGFLIPLIAYGFYKVTMASPGFAALEGAGVATSFVKGVF